MSAFVRLSFLVLAVLPLTLCGCDSGENETVVESGDMDAIQEYEAMIKAEEEQANKAMESAQ